MTGPPSDPGAARRVAIAVITFRRAELLKELLASLTDQHLAEAELWQVRIVVVDNDPDASASAVVEAARATLPWPISYSVEPDPGIPPARQRSVEMCTGDDAVIFVDDDETCPPGWLQALLACWQASGADVVTGPVHGVLPPGAPAWNAYADVHSSRGRHRTGDRLVKAYTNNTLVSARVLAAVTPAFDIRFRYTGSSDLHFFQRVHRAGFEIVWCEDAEVVESVPLSRTTAAWHARRAFRAGAGDTVSRRLIRPGPVSVLSSIGHGAARVASGVLLLVRGALPGGRRAWLKGLRRIASGVGSFAGLIGLNYQEYKR